MHEPCVSAAVYQLKPTASPRFLPQTLSNSVTLSFIESADPQSAVIHLIYLYYNETAMGF